MSSIENTYYPSGIPENYLKPQQVEDIKKLLISSQISLLEAELERKNGMFKETVSGVDGYKGSLLAEFRDGYNTSIQEDIIYIQDQITKCKELMK